MKQIELSNVEISKNYSIYKLVDGELIQLSKQEEGKRYGVKVPLDGEPYILQYTDEEEAQADQQLVTWEAGAEERENEERKLQEKQEEFENSLQYKIRIVAFLDILGWGNEVDNGQENDFLIREQGKTLAFLKSVAEFHNSLKKLLPDDQKWPGDPVMTQFSDSLVLSFDDDTNGNGKEGLYRALMQLSALLTKNGFLLRGGIVKGKIYHTEGLIFGPALKEAYTYESKIAVAPRVILERNLAVEWNVHQSTSREIMLGECPWIRSPDGYYFFNFLPPFMGNSFITDNNLWNNQLTIFRNMIVEKAKDRFCSEQVYAKYEWLANYFDFVCYKYSQANILEVSKEAKKLRLETTLKNKDIKNIGKRLLVELGSRFRGKNKVFTAPSP